MSRQDVITAIDKDGKYLTVNIENDEFSYQKVFKEKSIDFSEIKKKSSKGRTYKNLDLRFVDDDSKTSILVETKQNFNDDIDSAIEQLSAYVEYEKHLNPTYKIISIIANTKDDRIKVFNGAPLSQNELTKELKLKSFEEYIRLISPKTKNDRESVMCNTYQLNELLHKYGIKESLRSQFVGTCLLALKKGIGFKEKSSTSGILGEIRGVLEDMLSKNLNKAEKLNILDKKVLKDQNIRDLPVDDLRIILTNIRDKILPYINEESTLGQDLLNLFFTIFNKYIGKADKNQAFTPDHIVDFMCKAVGITKNSRVLDPCCGSGSFLVRALTDALDDCDTEEEKQEVKRNHIYGIEYEEKAFGLATTNMLIHGDGNSNIYQGSCFDKYFSSIISNSGIDVVLMNPPYNAQRNVSKPKYVEKWKYNAKEDPSKGFHFVYEVAQMVNKGMLAVLLPMQCAIGSDKEIKQYKELMLQNHRLDAVFSLPPDIFHPGASANACCMIFELGVRHKDNRSTFFGYYKDDGFVKRKNLGRVERNAGDWDRIKEKWLNTYINRKEISGKLPIKSQPLSCPDPLDTQPCRQDLGMAG